ncbi:ORF6N domain-containing protein [Chitinophaga sp.]|uniref:ORF6N domain-containing protein n=1 Tax=Chitinophaga sp. TaxID=1869181 RepID=UPI003452903E
MFFKNFMFEMDKEGFENWRTQFASTKEEFRGLRYALFCFSAQGVTMLSCVLSSERAIGLNIRIIRIFHRIAR